MMGNIIKKNTSVVSTLSSHLLLIHFLNISISNNNTDLLNSITNTFILYEPFVSILNTLLSINIVIISAASSKNINKTDTITALSNFFFSIIILTVTRMTIFNICFSIGLCPKTSLTIRNLLKSITPNTAIP